MLSASLRTRLEKTAIDNAFDLRYPPVNDWLVFASSQTPIRLWLAADADRNLFAAVSQTNVADELHAHQVTTPFPLPEGACASLGAPDIPALDRLLNRVFRLSLTLPNELLHVFERRTAKLPKSTEVERLVVQRVGQEIFRAALLDYWQRRCAITGLAVPELLLASHIKPWADCETDTERLDVYNGFLLAPHFDAAFDKGFLTVDNDGVVIVSPRVPNEAREVLGMGKPLRVHGLRDEHRGYLVWHRERVFRAAR